MSSIEPGYEYDIFISYRQKDNKGERWVSEFVDALKTELDSAFKEQIGLYFDANPHDGLLETHDVDATLKEKLKCLVFIPVLSRTYCDPASFAWEHEFRAFIGLASKDNFGLKVKLPNGNVTSRILPVFIHDLDEEDKKLVEQELGGFVRGIDFIYEEPGVNRPLTPRDKEGKNAKKTSYRNQINKVANAIRDILTAIKTDPVNTHSTPEQIGFEAGLEYKHNEAPQPDHDLKGSKSEKKFNPIITADQANTPLPSEDSKKRGSPTKIRIATYLGVFGILIFLMIYTLPKIFHQDPIKRLRAAGGKLSVAVMPFRNMTNDSSLDYHREGIRDAITNELYNHQDELLVRPPDAINGILESKRVPRNASILPEIAGDISKKINAQVYISGSLHKFGSTVRLNAQIIDSKTNESLKPFEIEGKSYEEDVMVLIDSLKNLVKNYLIMLKLTEKISFPNAKKFPLTTNSLEAFKNHYFGLEAIRKLDYNQAKKYFLQALKNDSNYFGPMRLLTTVYGDYGIWDSAKYYCRKIYDKKESYSDIERLEACATYARFFETPKEEINYFNQIYELDEFNSNALYRIGRAYNLLLQYDEAIPYFEKCLNMFQEWEIKPWWVYNYTLLGYAYHKTGQYKKETELYKKAEKDFPNDPKLLFWQAVLAFSLKKTGEANYYQEKYQSIQRENSVSEANIASLLANIYIEAGMYEKAEVYFRKALDLEPDKPARKNTFAHFLIKYDRNIGEGIDIAEKILAVNPDNYNSLRVKALGSYKQGKYKEALELFEKSWKLRRELAVYDHEASLQLETAKKTVADHSRQGRMKSEL